jgi:hypothetical protein
MRRLPLSLSLLLLLLVSPLLPALSPLSPFSASVAAADPLDDAQMLTTLQTIDDRQRNSGDYRALAFIEQKEKGKEDLLYESVIYRRDANDELVILFLRPKAEAGKGYLRIDKSLFFYDPTVGKWERRTERERIGGTDSNRADFDESRLSEEFTPSYVGQEKLGKFPVHHLKLEAKPGVDVSHPVVELWIDNDSNVLKRQEFALSGRLMRTAYYPKWDKIHSPSKNADVFFPREIRIFDEVEKGNSTTIVMREVDLTSLPQNIFTKAWLESQSR